MTKKKQSTEAAVREIRRRTRRKFAPEEKVRIVLEGLRGEQSISELRRYCSALRAVGGCRGPAAAHARVGFRGRLAGLAGPTIPLIHLHLHHVMGFGQSVASTG
jgi:hypothetical protein